MQNGHVATQADRKSVRGLDVHHHGPCLRAEPVACRWVRADKNVGPGKKEFQEGTIADIWAGDAQALTLLCRPIAIHLLCEDCCAPICLVLLERSR